MAVVGPWEEWLLETGLVGELGLFPLAGGLNNCGYQVAHDSGRLFLKHYSSKARLENEFRFLQLLDGGWTPRPVAKNDDLCLGLYEFIEGKSVQVPVPVTGVEQALQFLHSLQRLNRCQLPAASDACLKLREHWQAVLGRVERIDSALPPEFAEEWSTHWLPRTKRLSEFSAYPEVEPDELWVSPSDFGFHNALELGSGDYRFVDFEYAGLDDPSKVLSDFFAQPRVPAPLEGLPFFVEILEKKARQRLLWMWPVSVLKWSCIILKQLVPRQNFAHDAVEVHQQRAKLQWLRRRDCEVQELLGRLL